MIGFLFYILQDLFLFHPTSLPQQYVFAFQQPFKELNIFIAKEKRNLSIIQFTVPDSLQKGIVLFFHGNRRNVERYAVYVPYFTKNGYAVWMPDYPGFGKSTGKRTEQRINNDALLLYNMAAKETDAGNIIIYGKSIGTGVATQLASVKPCKQLILETPYYDINTLIRHYLPIYPTGMMIKYKFLTYLNLKNVHAPVTILHGTDDEVIPYQQAKRLQELYPQIELITIKGGKHNNLLRYPQFQKKLDSLLHH
ncbi:MAG: alpha/beta fold hydrolase [Flavisolibacter sp.]|nr:alpha/beta fold hydrolase [Flavisolibacter sp.]